MLVGARKSWRVSVFSAETSLGMTPAVCAAEIAATIDSNRAIKVRERGRNIRVGSSQTSFQLAGEDI